MQRKDSQTEGRRDGLDRRAFLGMAAGGMAAFALTPDLLGATRRLALGEVRVAIVGVGRQGRLLMGEIARIEGVRIVAVCDHDEARRLDGGRRAPGSKVYAKLEDMLSAGGFDAIIVATPTHTHREVGVMCMATGAHVYCECPLAHTLEDCAALVEAAASAKGVVAAGLQGRSNPVYNHALGFFLSDSVRDLVSMQGQWSRKGSWVTPASDPERYRQLNWRLDPSVSLGLAGEVGTQQFDVFHWYTDMYPKLVRGRGGIRLHDDGRTIPDTIALEMIFEDDAVLQYQATLANSYGGAFETMLGTNAAIKLAWTHAWMFKEADAPTQGWEVYATRQQFHNDEGITLIADATKLASQGKLKEGIGLPYNPAHYALKNWIDGIDTGKRAACSIAEASRATSVGIAANRAVMTGEVVEVELVG